MDDGIFPHECITKDCPRIVENDDEPWCYEHSPDEGSSLAGYSARRAAANPALGKTVKHNVFEE